MLGKEAEHWNEVARKWGLRSYSNELLAEHKRKTYLDLMAKWADVAEGQRILKTDLFAEAFGPEQFIFYVARANGNIVGIDVSDQIVDRAKEQAIRHAVDATKYFCCGVKGRSENLYRKRSHPITKER